MGRARKCSSWCRYRDNRLVDVADRAGARRSRRCCGLVARPDEEGAPTRDALVTARAFTVLLNRRARHGAVRAKHATVARLRLQPRAAAPTIVEELAGVGRQGL